MAGTNHRLYIDESGDHTYDYTNSNENSDSKYLGLTGVLFDNTYYRNELEPKFIALTGC